MSKKNKFFSRLRVLGVKSKVQYKTLDIPGKAITAKSFSLDSWAIFINELKTVLFKPVRQVSHFALILMVSVVLSTGLPAPMVEGEKVVSKVDPFGLTSTIEGTQEAGDKVTAVEVVASTISVIDTSKEEKMIKEAYELADAQAAKASLAVSGDAIAKVTQLSTTSSAPNRATFERYIVQNGETLWSIARKFGITTDSIKWSNKMSDADFVKPGQSLLIPTINGVLYTVKAGDSIEGIASRFKSSSSLIIAQNDLWGDEIKVGMRLIIPDGVVEEAPAPSSAPSSSRSRIATSYSSRGRVPSYISSSSGPNRFPWGYCTWYVASRRYVPWRGNAHAWYSNAQAYGRSVGRTPVPGAIMVTWESSVGHVAYVESVSGSSFTVSEMNYVGYGRVSRRIVSTRSVPLIGFIY